MLLADKQILRLFIIMKTTLLLILLFSFQAAAKISAQSVSLSLKNVSLSVAMDEISKQTSYEFAYNKKILKRARPVTLNIQNVTLEESLKQLFSNQPFTYSINDKIIIIEEKKGSKTVTTTQPVQEQQEPIRGRVTDSIGNPLAGATVSVLGTRHVLKTNNNGNFEIPSKYNNENPLCIMN